MVQMSESAISDSLTIDTFALQLRDISDVDLGSLHALSVSVSWPHRAEDWAFLRNIGHGLAAVDGSGRIHASAMWFPFGTDFATVGMTITTPRLQAGGGGAWLTRHILKLVGDRALGLHATRASYRMYRDFGFSEEGKIFQHQGIAAIPPELGSMGGADIRALRVSDHDAILALDARTTGTDRSVLLGWHLQWSDGKVLIRGGELIGYALARSFGRGTVIGPVVAENEADAAALIRPLIADRVGEFVRVDTGASEGEITRLLTLSGLSLFDKVTRMSLRRPWPLSACPPASVYALAAHTTG